MAEVKEKGKLPEGWKLVRLGEVANFFKGRKYLKADIDYEGKYEFIHYGELFTTYKEHIKEIISRIDKDDGAFTSRINDVLMPTSDVTPAGLATASCIKKDGVILGSDILVIRILSDLEGIFLSYLIRLKKTKILQLVKGTTVYHLYASDLKNFVFPLPPPPEQRKIAEILETIDNAIEKTDRVIEKYKRIKQGLMQDLLTKGIDERGQIRSEKTHRFKDSPLGSRVPEEWEVMKLEEILQKTNNAIKIGPFGSQLKKDEMVEEGYKVYGQENVFNKDFNIGNRFITKQKYKELKSCALEPGDFVISMMGTIGKCAIVPNNIKEGVMDSHLIRLKVNDQVFYKELLVYLIEESSCIQKQIINLSVGGIMQGLNSSIVKSLLVPHPSLTEQQYIASVLSQIDEVIRREQKYKEKLERIKKGLMGDLLTGKVRVNHLIEKNKKGVVDES